MHFETFDQDSNDWHAWRASGIGASEMAAVLGKCPWKTRYQLWLEKTGRQKRPSFQSAAMARGKALESTAREAFIREIGIDVVPECQRNETFPFLIASYDGINIFERIITEIKCPGFATHQKALSGVIPENYAIQMQHQLLVSGMDINYYYSFFDGKGIAIKMLPCIETHEKLIKEGEAFWKLVTSDTPPEKLPNEEFDVIEDQSAFQMIDRWKLLKNRIDKLEEEKIALEVSLKELCGDRNIMIGDVIIKRHFRKGNIDYKKVPQLQGVDLEAYRGKESQYYRFNQINL